MATRTITRLTDDIDGGEATQTVEFAYQGKTYKLDLNDRNASEFDEVLAPYIAVAQKVGTEQVAKGRRGARTATAGSGTAGPAVDTKAVRAWAEANGVPLAPRGRISAAVVEQYQRQNS